ncbi:mandelate racemase/muconate lactonizing enzyme family protein [Alteromonas macleodii]|uniref:mandelate racemase/muconate lactonizing enzyme family protein n=1 Tax=Alteromonas TaxID=226 RepID=UPI0010371A2F|nr:MULTISPECIES: mandelate racemase/muconate lactonizing enzyme family protein [Alteromonas]TAP30593.1 mandelate racemase/muconate lactonizing enzyme family protein [Alteromonas sp. KUL17]USI26404.1 mandelate racemase/muconate lactonizing enzyme family protein [Alteromonas macleodii]GEA01584.1 galactonate dehydratase [Alteromonas sp. KUL17]
MVINEISTFVKRLGFRNVLFVKVTCKCGTYGWGESGLSSREFAVAGVISHFEQFLIGRDAQNVAALWQEMYRSQYFEGGRVLSAAIAAIDIALYDILGKKLNVPIYQLLGGKQRNKVPLFATVTAPLDDNIVKPCLSLQEKGWTHIRLTTGLHGDINKTTVYDTRKELANAARAIIQVRKALGTDIKLGIDFHHRLSVAETKSFLQRLPDGVLDYIEEPIRAESPDSYLQIRSSCNTSFAIGEEFTSKWAFYPFLKNQLIDLARIDICNAGGFTEAMKIASLCETLYIDMMPHNPLSPLCTLATAQFCAAIPNLDSLEWLPYGDETSLYSELFSKMPQTEGPFLQLSDAPGLGIDINEDALRKLPFDYWEAPRLAKPDGSYTNW